MRHFFVNTVKAWFAKSGAASSGGDIAKVLRAKVLEELRYSASIVLSKEEVVPRSRVQADDGEWTVFVPLPNDPTERERRMRLVAGFMAWKSAQSFVISGELITPDVLYAAAVSRDAAAMAFRPILRTPLSVGPIEWHGRGVVGDDIWSLLPRGRVVLDSATERALIAAFGGDGEFKAERHH